MGALAFELLWALCFDLETSFLVFSLFTTFPVTPFLTIWAVA
jgi:hypothetical protein